MGGLDCDLSPSKCFSYSCTAAKFQIDGLGDQVEIHGVKVEWHYGSGSVTSRELKSRTASGDGLGSAVDNETSSTLSNIYTTWVPISLIGTDIEGDTTNDAYFVVRVNARKKGYCDGPYHLVSDRDKDWDDSLTTPYVSVGCNPKIFGDQNVKITELYGPNTEFSVLETATRQKRCMNAPTNEWWHLRDGSDNAPVPYTKHKLLPRDSTACEHCDALVGSGTHVLGWYDRIRTVSTAADERDKEVMKVFQMLYSKCGRAGSHTLQLRKYDITVGCRFAVSYPHRTDVTVLGTSPGLDMMAGHRFTQTNLVKALANGSVELSVGDLGVAPTTAIDWTAIGSSLYNMATAVVALTQPEIAAAMVVVKETYRLVMGNTTQDSSVFERAECYAVGGWTQIKADGTTGDYTRWQHHNNGSKGETFVPQTASLTRQLALEVGDTFVGAVRLGATCTLRTPVNSGFHDDGRDIDWDKISVAAKYKLTQGTFADTDIIHIHTNPN
jgi:hypothetical protein